MSNRWRVLVIAAAAAGAMAMGWNLAVRRWGSGKRPGASSASDRGRGVVGERRERSPGDEIEAMGSEEQEQMLRELSGLL